MALSEKETLASFRILIAVARADGALHADERLALEGALAGIALPEGVTLHNLLEEDLNLDFQIKQLESEESRTHAYQAAVSLAKADGHCSLAEQKVLDRLKTDLKITREHASFVDRLWKETEDTVLPSNIASIADPARREKEVKQDILKYSVFSGVLGAFPVPIISIATELAVIAVQLKMVRDIGQYHGHSVTNEAAKSLLAGLGLSAGARVAVNSLAKFVPIWGMAFAAATNFGTTWALGKVANQWFEGGCKTDLSVLKNAFTKAKEEGKAEYAANKDAIEKKKAADKTRIEALAADLKSGKITQSQYEAAVAELAKS